MRGPVSLWMLSSTLFTQRWPPAPLNTFCSPPPFGDVTSLSESTKLSPVSAQPFASMSTVLQMNVSVNCIRNCFTFTLTVPIPYMG
ncbi:hypothetical protein F5878DRAFT_627522 [Lentinula raphanica]|uniref:Uncharacterized protein n=1 Tax=Lentinula raphanica TaxID=153919 RepID=A0AA38UAP9_9AGAR|nr:hypothetical protein F5878DRAFT_627522 [Lentinula raphanica]